MLLLSAVLLSPSDSMGAEGDLDEGLSQIVSQIGTGVGKEGRFVVAVTEFAPAAGEPTDFEKLVADELTTRLSLQKRTFIVVERSRIAEVLRQLKIDSSALSDRRNAREFSRLTGADMILLGTVTDLSTKLAINARLVGIDGRIQAVAIADIVKDKRVARLRGETLPGTLHVSSDPERVSIYLNGRFAGETERGELQLADLSPGAHQLKVKKPGYNAITQPVVIPEGEIVKVEVALTRLPSRITPVLLSALMPGMGDFYLGRSDWWLYPLAVGGSIYGAVVYSKKTEEWIWVDDEKGRRLEKRGKGPVYLFAGLAAAIWIYDIWHVSPSPDDPRFARIGEKNRLGLVLELDAKGALLVFRYSFF